MIKKSFKEATLFITNKLYLFIKTQVKTKRQSLLQNGDCLFVYKIYK